MAAVGIAALAKPLAQCYADRSHILGQQARIERLQKLHDQQAELLTNAQTPSVVERQAINRLNYVPTEPDGSGDTPLPQPWPNLQAALATIDQPPADPALPAHKRFITTLAQNQATQGVLMILGCALTLIAMTCFNRTR
ncbi:MAG: hypothetical protein ACTSX7_11070 [Alphaproteobacteria bacterium]